MIRRTMVLLCGLLILRLPAASQDYLPAMSQEYDPVRSLLVEDLIERIARQTDQDLDYQTLFETLIRTLESPLPINTATRGELEELQLLTDFQIASLQQYTEENGPLLSIYELPLVFGFSTALAMALEPFFQFGLPERDLPVEIKGRHQLLLRASSVLEKQEGYRESTDSSLADSPSSRYLGSRAKLMMKYRYTHGRKWMLGYNGEKDAGEPFFKGENAHGFDFNSLYFRINDVWKFKHILAGDYQVKTGQGLNLWSGLAFGKSPDIVNLRRRGEVLRQYSSTDENRFMRGVAATVQSGDFELTTFASRKRIDANRSADSLPAFTSFQHSGYHRTPGEMEDRASVGETVIGGHLSWQRQQWKVGLTGLHYRYDMDYQQSAVFGSAYDFRGRSNCNVGLDYTLVMDRLSFFGEAGYSAYGQSLGLINGTGFVLHPQVSISLLHRYLASDYQALYGNPFRENSRNSNENGLYLGVEVRPLPHWRVSAYLDAYRFPRMHELFGDADAGYDYHLQADYHLPDRIHGYLRFRYKSKPENVNLESRFDPSETKPESSHLRFHLVYPVTTALTFQNRLELSFYAEEMREQGWLAYHDIIYKPQDFPLNFSFRYAMFDTDSYQSRIYTYEHDVLYAFAIPSYFGRGIRTYLNTRLELGRHVDLWFKYALSWYPDRETIGSGLNEIQGNRKSDLSLQLRVKF